MGSSVAGRVDGMAPRRKLHFRDRLQSGRCAAIRFRYNAGVRRWELTLALDPDGELPLFLQLATAIADAIRRGRLKPGDPLPGTRALAERLGVRELYIKNDAVNYPTLSFKDRVVSVALSRAKELGIQTVACASTGNLANAVAAHAASAGLRSFVLIPSDLERGKKETVHQQVKLRSFNREPAATIRNNSSPLAPG